MLDYVRTTPPLPIQCQELAKRMLSLANNIPGENNEINCENIIENYSNNRDKTSNDVLNNKKNEEKNKSLLNIGVNSSNHEIEDLLPSTALTQLTVNEYLAGQGIAQHIGQSVVDFL